MSRRRPSNVTRGGAGAGRAHSSRDFWGSGSTPPPVTPVVRAADPSALVRSLGPAPLTGQLAGDFYVAAVVERAASLAAALAAAAGVLESPQEP